ncbi:MAG: hypothetical protein Q4D20_11255, partial [Clostridia bacterium]|nr:hypothetical protein [Clostridia bacterium]
KATSLLPSAAEISTKPQESWKRFLKKKNNNWKKLPCIAFRCTAIILSAESFYMRLRLPAPLNIAGKPGIFGNFQIERAARLEKRLMNTVFSKEKARVHRALNAADLSGEQKPPGENSLERFLFLF